MKLEMTFIGSPSFEEAVALLLNSVGTIEQFRVSQVDPVARKRICGWSYRKNMNWKF